MPSKVLVLYGCENWVIFKDTNISEILPSHVKAVHIWEIDHLKHYLQNEDTNLEKIILPLQIYKQQELNWNNIKNVYGNSNETIEMFDNKKSFVNYAKSVGIGHLVPYVYETYNDEYNYNDTKVIVKDPLNCYGKGIEIKPLRELNQSILNNSLVQEYVYSNVEYDGEFIVSNGYIQGYKIYKKVMKQNNDVPYFHGGHVSYDSYSLDKIDLDRRYIDQVEKFLIPRNYSGFCCMDFKIIDGNVKVFEINPRIGGTIASRKWDFADLLNFFL
jgi:hypothetical protein